MTTLSAIRDPQRSLQLTRWGGGSGSRPWPMLPPWGQSPALLVYGCVAQALLPAQAARLLRSRSDFALRIPYRPPRLLRLTRSAAFLRLLRSSAFQRCSFPICAHLRPSVADSFFAFRFSDHPGPPTRPLLARWGGDHPITRSPDHPIFCALCGFLSSPMPRFLASFVVAHIRYRECRHRHKTSPARDGR
jgi:hypothetical protein